MKRFIVVLVVLIVLGLIAGSVKLFLIGKITEGSILLAVSIIVTIWLGYPVYQSTREGRIPVATLELIPKKRHLLREFEVLLHNNCNQAIQANFNLDITMWDRPLTITTEISKGPIVINPHEDRTVCTFDVARIIVDHFPYSYDQLEHDERTNPDNAILRLNIEAQEKPEQANKILRFKMTVNYFGLISKKKGNQIIDERFYDFKNMKMADLFPPVA